MRARRAQRCRQQFCCYVSWAVHGAVQTLRNPYRRNPIDTVVRKPRYSRDRPISDNAGGIRNVACDFEATSPQEYAGEYCAMHCRRFVSRRDKSAAPWERRAIGVEKKRIKKTKEMRWPFGEGAGPTRYGVFVAFALTLALAAHVPRIG